MKKLLIACGYSILVFAALYALMDLLMLVKNEQYNDSVVLPLFLGLSFIISVIVGWENYTSGIKKTLGQYYYTVMSYVVPILCVLLTDFVMYSLLSVFKFGNVTLAFVLFIVPLMLSVGCNLYLMSKSIMSTSHKAGCFIVVSLILLSCGWLFYISLFLGL